MQSQRRVRSLFLLAMLGLALALSLPSAQPTRAENTKRMLKRGGDLDGDGKKDLIVFNTATATWKYILSSDTSRLVQTIQFGDPGSWPAPGDYDGDGRTDLAAWNSSTGVWSFRLATTQVFYRTLGASGDRPVPADYTNDGKTDAAVWRKSDGSWRWIISGTNTVKTTYFQTGTVPVPGDYDNDGNIDLAVYNQTSRVWTFGRSWYGTPASNPGSFTQSVGGTPVVDSFLTTTSGQITPTVYDRNTGSWYWNRLDLPYNPPAVMQWGSPADSDTPVGGDYDGDGISDYAVWSSTTGLWKIKPSRGGNDIHWVLGGDYRDWPL